MFEKFMSQMSDEDVSTRTDELRMLARQVQEAVRNLGLATSGCRTVCEERLVVVNGRLRKEVVCHTVCS
jgi:hypothetical protein